MSYTEELSERCAVNTRCSSRPCPHGVHEQGRNRCRSVSTWSDGRVGDCAQDGGRSIVSVWGHGAVHGGRTGRQTGHKHRAE